MKKKAAQTAAVVICALIAVLLTAGSGSSLWAEECRVVKITMEKGTAPEGAVELDPAALTVKKGTCVIWVNWVKGARVTFKEDGKHCDDASYPASGFITAENCYLTDFLECGGTSSLLFNQAGTFNYVIELPDTRQATPAEGVVPGVVAVQGKIIVEQ